VSSYFKLPQTPFNELLQVYYKYHSNNITVILCNVTIFKWID